MVEALMMGNGAGVERSAQESWGQSPRCVTGWAVSPGLWERGAEGLLVRPGCHVRE